MKNEQIKEISSKAIEQLIAALTVAPFRNLVSLFERCLLQIKKNAQDAQSLTAICGIHEVWPTTARSPWPP